MTPAQYKKIARIRQDLEKIKEDLGKKIETAYHKSEVTSVMENSVQYGAVTAVLEALTSVG